MYQTQIIPQNRSSLFSPVLPQGLTQTYTTQSFIPQVPQVITVPQVTTNQVLVSQVPQVQSVIPTVQTIIPTQTVITNPIQPQFPQGANVVPFILPIGSRMPMAMEHQGQIPSTMNFSNIGGCRYGRISMIK